MGKRGGSKSRRRGQTRFNLSRSGETALAWTGAAVLVAAAAALFFWARPRLFPADPAELHRLEALARADATLYTDLLTRGVLLAPGARDENLFLDRDKWLAMSRPERERAAGATARHLKLPRAFFLDGSGGTLGWYLEGAGYKEPDQNRPVR